LVVILTIQNFTIVRNAPQPKPLQQENGFWTKVEFTTCHASKPTTSGVVLTRT
jgi:hypothetical protein